MYQVQLADLGDDVIKRARTFAENVVDETQNKFPYNYNRRIDTIYIGKLA